MCIRWFFWADFHFFSKKPVLALPKPSANKSSRREGTNQQIDAVTHNFTRTARATDTWSARADLTTRALDPPRRRLEPRPARASKQARRDQKAATQHWFDDRAWRRRLGVCPALPVGCPTLSPLTPCDLILLLGLRRPHPTTSAIRQIWQGQFSQFFLLVAMGSRQSRIAKSAHSIVASGALSPAILRTPCDFLEGSIWAPSGPNLTVAPTPGGLNLGFPWSPGARFFFFFPGAPQRARFGGTTK